MSTQLGLFDTPPRPLREAMAQATEAQRLARRADPETSKQAAREAVTFTGKHEAAIFGAIHDAGERGATAKEIARSTGLTDVQVNRRLGAMGERGLIERRYEGGELVKREGCAIWWRR